jgi:cytoskeletal protein RodZ
MDVHQEHDEPQRREGFGSRVRRFIDSELGRALDKDDSPPDAPATAAAEPASTVTPATTAAAEPTTTVTPATTAAVEPTTTVTHTTAAEPTTTVTPAATAAEPTTTAGPATPVTAEETTPPRADGRRTDQAAADGNAERVGLLNDPAGLRDQWQQVQGTFVDDPQRAVHEASVLVDRTLREIHENVSRGQISDPTSTEDLRVSFQRYREFFQRLLSA